MYGIYSEGQKLEHELHITKDRLIKQDKELEQYFKAMPINQHMANIETDNNIEQQGCLKTERKKRCHVEEKKEKEERKRYSATLIDVDMGIDYKDVHDLLTEAKDHTGSPFRLTNEIITNYTIEEEINTNKIEEDKRTIEVVKDIWKQDKDKEHMTTNITHQQQQQYQRRFYGFRYKGTNNTCRQNQNQQSGYTPNRRNQRFNTDQGYRNDRRNYNPTFGNNGRDNDERYQKYNEHPKVQQAYNGYNRIMHARDNDTR
ncbi:hypothetical protein C1646_665078 [Rhizophagus diaphanus]|nr:hypothetical protein C1646_665078 [Rhizophagus diaphanus] [Rhizophagus sp. MUCL 43196]